MKFNFHWLEYEAAALVNVVPATDATPWHFGDTTGSWPFPIKQYMAAGTNDGKASDVMWTDQPNTFDLNAYAVGEPGFLISQTNAGSIWDGEATANVSYASAKAEIEAYNTRVAAYNTALTGFNSAAAAYNSAVVADRARDALAAPIAIPSRPCPPSAVGAFTGFPMRFDQTAALTAAEKTQECRNPHLDGRIPSGRQLCQAGIPPGQRC